MPEKFSKTIKSVILPGGKEVLNDKKKEEGKSRDKSSDS